MKLNFRIMIALALVVAVAYFAFDAISTKTYSGSQANFSINSGYVAITNDADEPIQITMSASRVFHIARSDGGENMVSFRDGSGRNARQIVTTTLPPGNIELSIARGSDVNFEMSSNGTFATLVVPRSRDDTVSIIALAAVLILGLVGYAAYQSRNSWMRWVRRDNTSALAHVHEKIISP